MSSLRISLFNATGLPKQAISPILQLSQNSDLLFITETWLLSPNRYPTTWSQYHTYGMPTTVGQKTDARNCKIPVLQLVVYGYCTKLSQTLIVSTSLERAFIRRLSDMGNDYWRNLI